MQVRPLELPQVIAFWERRWTDSPLPIPTIKVREPYYLHECYACKFTGSSELFGVVNYGDDAAMNCPKCGKEN